MALALFQPDQAMNVGTILRMGACLDVPVHIIEPCGFAFSPKAVRRSLLDYAEYADIRHHADWATFLDNDPGRLILLTTRAACVYTDFAYRPGDVLLLGQESAGAPDYVHARADARVVIPMAPGRRSLNIAMAAAMVLGEALRQIGRG